MPVFSNLDYYSGVMQSQTLELYQRQWEAYERVGLEMLRSRAQVARDAGLAVEFTQNPGSPSRVICELAEMWKADLVVVGRRGRSGFSELLMGSVSNYVLHHAPCSVLIIHPNPSGKSETSAEQPTEAMS
jgi:nucleotide-binding universal stress UspA family protein